MRKIAFAFAAALGAAVTAAPAAATVTTTTYSVSGTHVVGTFSTVYDSSSNTTSLGSLNLGVGTAFDASNSSLVSLGGSSLEVGGNASGGPGNVAFGTPDFQIDFDAALSTQSVGADYVLTPTSPIQSEGFTLDQAGGGPDSTTFTLSGGPGAGSFTVAQEFVGGQLTDTLSALGLVFGAGFDTSNAELLDYGGGSLQLGGTASDGGGIIVSNTDDFQFAFNPALASQSTTMAYALFGEDGVLASDLTINQLGQTTIPDTPPPPSLPEPATWAMMLLGFGAIGLALRRGRRTTLAIA
jgi:hypothetical protein